MISLHFAPWFHAKQMSIFHRKFFIFQTKCKKTLTWLTCRVSLTNSALETLILYFDSTKIQICTTSLTKSGWMKRSILSNKKSFWNQIVKVNLFVRCTLLPEQISVEANIGAKPTKIVFNCTFYLLNMYRKICPKIDYEDGAISIRCWNFVLFCESLVIGINSHLVNPKWKLIKEEPDEKMTENG